MKEIYIVMTVLPTFINHVVYCLTGFEYTHFSVALDKNLKKLYSFQIKNKATTLVGGFMEEDQVFYFHGKKNISLKQVIYKIPVTNEEYISIIKFLNEIKNDNEYTFNYISAWLMFVLGGVKSYKAYHCVEFICEVLNLIKVVQLPKRTHKMHPKDLYNVLNNYQCEVRTIDANDYDIVDDLFLKKIKLSVAIKKSLYSIKESFCRAILQRKSKKYNYRNLNFYNEDCYIKEKGG